MNEVLKSTSAATTSRAEVLATAMQVSTAGIAALDRVESELARIAVLVAETRLKTDAVRIALEQVGAAASALQGKASSDG